MEPTKRLEVVGGPSKFDLMNAVFFRKHPRQSIELKILDENGKEKIISFNVECIMPYDQGKSPGDEGSSWRMCGSTYDLEYNHRSVITTHCLLDYSTKTRVGWLESLGRKWMRVYHSLGIKFAYATEEDLSW